MATNTFKREAVNEPRAKNEPKSRNESKSGSGHKESKGTGPKWSIPAFRFRLFKDRRFQLLIGFFLLLTSLYLTISFVSYLFTGHADQSVVEALHNTGLKDSGLESENWLGLFGAWVSYYFIYEWLGVAAFFLVPIIFFFGFKIIFRAAAVSLTTVLTLCLFSMSWVCITMGYGILITGSASDLGFLSGGIGYESAIWLNSLIGWGTGFLLLFLLMMFVVFFFNVTTLWKPGPEAELAEGAGAFSDREFYKTPSLGINHQLNPTGSLEEDDEEEEDLRAPVLKRQPVPEVLPTEVVLSPVAHVSAVSGLKLDIELPEAQSLSVAEAAPLAEHSLDLEIERPMADPEDDSEPQVSENYDPTLGLSRYQPPTIDLLTDYGGSKVQVSKEELEANKDKIVETLGNYSIGIASIKATIGPTVTLYEIVPEAGVRISKIKNLEDDIALSLAALGIRIIAPIPGKGTIGIEVPNKKKEMVPIKSLLSTEKFQKSEMDLPIAFGKTITNEVFIADLAKMPHLLMAGATGQGKSVGLNVILTSLLYKRHPSQLKFVLVDPKKVELSLFNKIERHFLAKLPDCEEPIITDTSKVVNTLNSLCMEMDMRYDLLKDAGCRNLKEYNLKFVERRLNPKNGHRFMPFIVLVIDELADLMMTAGKEVETPIARLAQLARAIGIHLVVATQRPSVNVITGIIKANFPARISFKVTSKIDSRTILDAGGADQLIGQGDMLFSLGSDIIRVQCAFVDTPEVDRICEFIGNQQGYDDAYLLPEFVGDESGTEKTEFDPSQRDNMFEEAARIVVTHQQGSTSLLQRRLKLGYNRAGRLIDQLESAGVVGPFEGSKAREVLIPDEYSLEQLLNRMDK
jgi:DNA segregation ATPase FtsK/SpoIIIE, S-DNA-T family